VCSAELTSHTQEGVARVPIAEGWVANVLAKICTTRFAVRYDKSQLKRKFRAIHLNIYEDNWRLLRRLHLYQRLVRDWVDQHTQDLEEQMRAVVEDAPDHPYAKVIADLDRYRSRLVPSPMPDVDPEVEDEKST